MSNQISELENKIEFHIEKRAESIEKIIKLKEYIESFEEIMLIQNSELIKERSKNAKLTEGLNQIDRFLDKGIPTQYTQTPKQIINNLLRL